MTRTLLTGVGAAVCVALLLAACGSSETARTTSTTTTSTTTAPTYGSTTYTPAPSGATTIERSTTTKTQ